MVDGGPQLLALQPQPQTSVLPLAQPDDAGPQMVIQVQHLVYPLPPGQPVLPGAASAWNWSHFKPEFSGKPDEGAEKHLLRTNEWMDTHAFPDFCESP